MSAATGIIEWKNLLANNKPLLVVKTDPESLYAGDSFKVKLYSAYNHALISPYDGLGAKTIEPVEPITETVELSGSSEMNTEFPINSVISLRALLPIVDETTRTIVIETGDNARDFVSVVNQRLRLMNESLKLHGSITIIYNTFDAQVWQHKPFASKGKAMLFAHNLDVDIYENVPLSINERTANKGLKIEGRAVQPERGFNPYHSVIIYPNDAKQLIVKATRGSVRFRGIDSHDIENEQVNFSGKELSTSYPITKLNNISGDWFNRDGNAISPGFRLDNGIIKSDIDCYGIGFIDYTTRGLWYDYNADVKIDTVTNTTTIKIGYIFAYERGKFDSAVSYQVPQWQSDTKQPIDFYTVTRKVLSQRSRTFECPPNWDSDDNTYPSQPNLSPNDLPEIGSGFVSGVVIESGYVDVFGSIDYSTHSNAFYEPYHGSEINPDAVYEIQVSIPSEIVDSSLISALNDKIEEAKQRWGIA